jgi:threonylcarbamoyladenosine tRNA methylthiotransferase MtaB
MADILTFGCRLNIQESEEMRRLLDGRDDLVVVNSCAVTGEAGRQARQAIRRAKRERPEARIVVTGCGAEVETARYAGMPEVAHVLGNAGKLDAGTWRGLGTGAPRVIASDIMAEHSVTASRLNGFEGRVRGFVQVQNGCDHRCTFCVIPFGRGRSRSLPPQDAVAAVRRLVENGVAEIVLTGVDVTSYGVDLEEGPTLGRLVATILAEVPDLRRLRLSSLDAVEIDDDLLALLADEERLMPHLHLSLQAGDDLVLKRMKRRHTANDAVRFCENARRLRPDIALGADIIAGFPTETEAMFARSLDLVEACGLAHLHVFPFSPRPGTPAARMPPVPHEIVKERARRLREAGEASLARCLDREAGLLREILTEHGGLSRTSHFFPVILDEPPPPGTISTVTITGHDGRRLFAENVAQSQFRHIRSAELGV